MASLRNLVETAVSGALASITDANIYVGNNDADKEMPCIICSATSAEEIIYQSGNYGVTVEITIEDRDETVIDTLSQSVRALIGTSQLVEDLNIAGLKVWGVESNDSLTWGNSGDARTETRTITIVCAAFAFPA